MILALNGLSSDYNTFICMIRGRDTPLSLKDFRSQLLAEEAILEHTQSASPFVSAMMAQNQTFQGKALVLDEESSPSHSFLQSQGYSSNSKTFPSSELSGGFTGHHGNVHNSTGGFNGPHTMYTNNGHSNSKGSYFRGRGRSRGHYQIGPRPHQMPSSSPGILGSGITIPICQIYTKKGHVAAGCYQRHNQSPSSTSSVQC